jgi:hypothetical protein
MGNHEVFMKLHELVTRPLTPEEMRAFVQTGLTGSVPRGWKREVVWAADAGSGRWLMTISPGRLDVFFALAATTSFAYPDGNIVSSR